MPVTVVASKPQDGGRQPQNYRFIGKSYVRSLRSFLTAGFLDIAGGIVTQPSLLVVASAKGHAACMTSVNLTDPVFRGFHHGRQKHDGRFCLFVTFKADI